MTDLQASPFQHQVEGYKNIIGSFERRRDHAMKLVARRDDLDLRLTREFRNGFSGISGSQIELPDLSKYRRASPQHRNCYCSVDSRTFAPTFQARSCYYTLVNDVRPLLILAQMSSEGCHFPTGFCFGFKKF